MHALKHLLLTLPVLTTAHFVLHYPPSAGFDEDKEPTSPCGGFTPTLTSTSPSLPVDRFQVLIQNVHPVGEWSFRGTTSTATPFEWEEIVPVVNTTGVSNFCLEHMRAPQEWAGKGGVLQVVDRSADGILYQCAAVNWVAGSNDTIGSACANSSSSFTATWTTLEGFDGEQGAEPSGQSYSSMTSMTSATAAATSSSSGGAAVATAFGGIVVGGLGMVAAGLAL